MKHLILLLSLISASLTLTAQADPDLPFTFEDTATVDYALRDFDGTTSQIVVDPTDPNNLVVETLKDASAATFAGTVMADSGMANPIPFTANSTQMNVRVWSPDAGIPVRLKVEDASDPTISVETEATTTVAMAWETLTFDFSNEATGTAPFNPASTYNKAVIFFNFGTDGATAGAKTYYWDDVDFGEGASTGKANPALPFTFEDTATVDYALRDFNGTTSQIVVDPTDPNNLVVETLKDVSAATFAGTVAADNGMASPIPFTASNTQMTVRVWSPDAGIPVRLKVENSGDPAISVETEATTVVAMAWDTLTFDFTNEAMGTAPLDPAATYDKAIIFFNFDTDGATAGAKTYYWDDVAFVMPPSLPKPELPLTFEDTATLDYNLNDFGGNASQIIVDPTDPNNLVVESIKTGAAEDFAGTTAGNEGLASPIPFVANNTRMTVRVWSPDAGIPVRLKVEDATDPAISVETEATTTVASNWETLEFDFSDPVAGTSAIDFNNTYDKVSIFFNFGVDGPTAGAKTYYWDDVAFLDSIIIVPTPDLPITFEDTATLGDYAVFDFGGAASQIVVDPTNPDNLVVETLRTDQAETFAGTTAGEDGLASAIPFTQTETKMSVAVWSPEADIPVRLKVEAANDPTISVETEVTTNVAMEWEYLVFDFDNEVMGTAALNLASTYDKVSIFFNFGAEGAAAGAQTYYWDNVSFGDSTGVTFTGIAPMLEGVMVYPNPAQDQLHVRFEALPMQPAQATLYDLSGRQVKATTVQELTTTLELGDLPQGMYLFQLKSNEGTFRQKVVVRR